MTSQQQWKYEVANDLTAEGYEEWLLTRVPVWIISRYAIGQSASTRWFSNDRADLVAQQFARECTDYVGTNSCIRMVKMLVPNYVPPQKTTEHIDSDLDWVEAIAPPVAEVWTYDPNND